MIRTAASLAGLGAAFVLFGCHDTGQTMSHYDTRVISGTGMTGSSASPYGSAHAKNADTYSNTYYNNYNAYNTTSTSTTTTTTTKPAAATTTTTTNYNDTYNTYYAPSSNQPINLMPWPQNAPPPVYVNPNAAPPAHERPY
jgi:hypothetical protein